MSLIQNEKSDLFLTPGLVFSNDRRETGDFYFGFVQLQLSDYTEITLNRGNAINCSYYT